MKKIICFVAAIVCAMALMACGGNAANSTAPETTAAPETTLAPAPYKAGTFEASAKGFASDVKVTLTFDEAGVITEVVIDASGETPALGGVAAEKLVDKIKTAQSAEIDAMSGATFTSKAIITAVQDCLNQAANN